MLPPAGRTRETNGLAIASLVLGIIALVPVAIVLGIIALVQIKRRGDGGRGLAIAGIAVSCGWVVVAIAAVALYIGNLAEFDEYGRVTEGGLISELDLDEGMCLNDPDEDSILLGVVLCDEPHDTEVFARFTLEGDGYPGSGNIRRRATAGCRNRRENAFEPRIDALVVDVTFFSPDPIDWTIGDHDVICFAKFGEKRADPASVV